MLKTLQEKNPDLKIYSIFDEAFRPFGKVIELDTADIIAAANTIDLPATGASYVPSEPKFEVLPIAEEIKNTYFGQMPTQVGFCWGHSSFMNAVEWHTSTEINIAVTPLMLFLGERKDLDGNHYDSEKLTVVYVPAGTAFETYATTLHFCPCEVQAEGFRFVVALPTGTNTALATPSENPLLFATNKWMLTHVDNQVHIAKGVVPGVTGVNYEIKY
jgi:hypothetical protein